MSNRATEIVQGDYDLIQNKPEKVELPPMGYCDRHKFEYPLEMGDFCPYCLILKANKIIEMHTDLDAKKDDLIKILTERINLYERQLGYMETQWYE